MCKKCGSQFSETMSIHNLYWLSIYHGVHTEIKKSRGKKYTIKPKVTLIFNSPIESIQNYWFSNNKSEAISQVILKNVLSYERERHLENKLILGFKVLLPNPQVSMITINFYRTFFLLSSIHC